MQSKTLSFNKGIIYNDLKRFGWIGAVYTLILLFTVPLQILMQLQRMERFDALHNPFRDIFLFRMEIQGIFMLAIPVLAAIFLFRYLQVKQSVDMYHALPIRRGNLYNNHILVGTLILVVPVIITAVVSWLLNITFSLGNYYTLKHILIWVGITCLMNMFVFLFSVFIGIVTGNSVVQGVLTYIILLLPLGLSMLLLYNIDSLVYGFAQDYYLTSQVDKYSPITRVFGLRKLMQLTEVVIYFAAAVASYFIGRALYSRRNLEAASEAIAFKSLRPIFKYGVTFCTMLLAGVYFWKTQYSLHWMFFGYLVGSLLGYFVAEILITKSLRVLGSIKGYLVYAVVIILVTVGISYDFIGYEKHVPPLENINNVYFGYSIYNYNRAGNSDKIGFYFTKDNIENIRKLHQQLAKNRNLNEFNGYVTRDLVFVYTLTDGDKVSRQYSIRQEDYDSYFKPIYESKEYKQMHYNLLSIEPDQIDKITINPQGNASKKVDITSPKEIREAVSILKKEINSASYGEMTNDLTAWAGISLLLSDDKRIGLEWKKEYTEFEQWLKGNGYLSQARVMPEDVAYVVVQEIASSGTLRAEPVKMPVETRTVEEAYDGKQMKIVDKDKIEVCLRNLSDQWRKQRDYIQRQKDYMLIFYSQDNRVILEGSYSEDTVPDFVLNYFND